MEREALFNNLCWDNGFYMQDKNEIHFCFHFKIQNIFQIYWNEYERTKCFFKKIEKRQSNSMVPEQEWFWPPGGAWQCLKTFGVVTTWEGEVL